MSREFPHELFCIVDNREGKLSPGKYEAHSCAIIVVCPIRFMQVAWCFIQGPDLSHSALAYSSLVKIDTELVSIPEQVTQEEERALQRMAIRLVTNLEDQSLIAEQKERDRALASEVRTTDPRPQPFLGSVSGGFGPFDNSDGDITDEEQ